VIPKRFSFWLPVLVVLLVAQPLCAQPRYLGLTLLTTNDLHANLQPFHVVDGQSDVTPSPDNVGGAARRATLIRQTRSQATDHVFLLDSGDTTFGRTPTAKAFRGAADVEMMNTIGYDVMAPGNHEFEWHSEDTLRNREASKFPWVCANLVEEKTGKLFTQPYVVREVDGVRIAFFGLIAPLVNDPRYVGARELGLKAVDPVETAKNLIPELRQKADIVILLSHLGTTPDVELAEAVPGIDAVLGGHSHTRLPQPTLVSVGEPTAFSIAAVPVVQAGRWGDDLGHTRLIFRRDTTTCRYSLMSCFGELLRIDRGIHEDPEIAALVERWAAKAQALGKR